MNEVQDAQKQSVETAKVSNKRATNTALQLATSLLRNMEFEKNAKVATNKLIDMQRQVAGSVEAANDALKRLAETLKRVGLLEEEAQVLKPKLSRMKKAHVSAVADSDGRMREVWVLEAHKRMWCDQSDLLKRLTSKNCYLEAITHKVAASQSDITKLVTRLHRCTVRSYNSIRLSVGRALFEVNGKDWGASKSLKIICLIVYRQKQLNR